MSNLCLAWLVSSITRGNTTNTSMEYPGTDKFIADKLQSPDVSEQGSTDLGRAAQTLAGPRGGHQSGEVRGTTAFPERDFPRGPLDMFFCWKFLF